jgi:hypothetical protein
MAKLVLVLLGLLGALPAFAAETTIPDLSANNVAWDGDGENDFSPPKSGPGPVLSDPANPYISNFKARRTGQQPNWRIADLANPILKPWVVEALRQQNAEAGAQAMWTRESRCWPTGVPAMLLNPILLFFVQTPEKVVIIQEADHRVRHVWLNRPHSPSPKPSWYGESVGHYENGDTLVVDTIGLNDKSFVDSYRTPHTAQMHVIERFALRDGGKTLEATVTVDDPGAFTMPWSAIKRWKRTQGPLKEEACAENNEDRFNQNAEPMPHADTADF